jgi:hypothetical protein
MLKNVKISHSVLTGGTSGSCGSENKDESRLGYCAVQPRGDAYCPIALLNEAVITPETLDYSNGTTRRSIPEGSRLHTCRRENLNTDSSNSSITEQNLREQTDTGAS